MPGKVPGKGKKNGHEVGARTPVPGSKAKFCMYHLQGACKYTDSSCAFAHSIEEIQSLRCSRRSQAAQGGKEGHLSMMNANGFGSLQEPRQPMLFDPSHKMQPADLLLARTLASMPVQAGHGLAMRNDAVRIGARMVPAMMQKLGSNYVGSSAANSFNPSGPHWGNDANLQDRRSLIESAPLNRESMKEDLESISRSMESLSNILARLSQTQASNSHTNLCGQHFANFPLPGLWDIPMPRYDPFAQLGTRNAAAMQPQTYQAFPGQHDPQPGFLPPPGLCLQ
mmetsp:Transcript_75600/g.136327  ORF Transcript_75600/g.136327 Transcript_75600/m.136327 type:complete len:282 (+) Transcript_75600:143-988(+)